jgi:type VI secretion system VgrG family protein
MSDAQRSGGSSRDVVEVATAEMRERIPEVERFLIPADALTLDGVTLPSRAALVGFRGREAVSALYRFDVLFSLPRGVDIEMRELLSTRITLGVAGDGPTPVKLHGIVAELQLLEAMPERAYYRAVMVPEAWHLGLSAHSRIFTEATVPQIIEAVLRNAGYETDQFELRLTESYPALEHVCQYRESDLTFLSRLMEKHGLYYFFEHGDTREKLVIIDDQSAHAPFTASATRFVPWGHDATRARQSGIDRFRCKVSALPSMVRLADYDPLRPQLMLRGDAAVSAGRGDVVLYGENLRTPDGGQRLARLRAQELLANETVYEGSGAGNLLRTGFTFEFTNTLSTSAINRVRHEPEHFGVRRSGSAASPRRSLERHCQLRAARRPADVSRPGPDALAASMVSSMVSSMAAPTRSTPKSTSTAVTRSACSSTRATSSMAPAPPGSACCSRMAAAPKACTSRCARARCTCSFSARPGPS